MLSQLPNSSESTRQLPVHSEPSPVQLPPATAQVIPPPAPVQATPSPAPYSPPTAQFGNASLNEKHQAPVNTPPPQQYYSSPPPAYPQAPTVLSVASALYAYTPTDAGDLALQPNDRVQVLEHMNPDCMFTLLETTMGPDTNPLQGGVVATSAQTSRVSSLAAMSMSWTKRLLHSLLTTETCRSMSARVALGHLANTASLRSTAKSLARRWVMLVCHQNKYPGLQRAQN